MSDQREPVDQKESRPRVQGGLWDYPGGELSVLLNWTKEYLQSRRKTRKWEGTEKGSGASTVIKGNHSVSKRIARGGRAF